MGHQLTPEGSAPFFSLIAGRDGVADAVGWLLLKSTSSERLLFALFAGMAPDFQLSFESWAGGRNKVCLAVGFARSKAVRGQALW